jgi:hypothetical protein
MSVITIPKPLRLILGEEATDSLVTVINNVDQEGRKDLATKADIQLVRAEIQQVKTELKAENQLLRWMIGFIFAGVASLVLKTFFIG